MSNFTYAAPNENQYFAGIIQMAKSKDQKLAEILKAGRCDIATTSKYSGKRWDAMQTTIYINLPIDQIDKITKVQKEILLSVCNILMPKVSGFDVTEVEITPILDTILAEPSLATDMEAVMNNSNYSIIQALPQDIRQKGAEMAEVYAYLYCIENTLRVFIEKIGVATHGAGFFASLNISTNVNNKILQRKAEEQKNKWRSMRGSSELYYLDFKELSDIITNNWPLFNSYFPDQSFLVSKVNEMTGCRNLVAHNSYVGQAERELLRLYYNQLLQQMN